jgi:glycosyltransferase involved in cell wall biosynthesis
MKIKLSAVIITFNEEANLERCLTSLTNVVDEIVVVDSFSSDNTKKVAQNFHVRFFENKFEGHIQQKNFAITKASYKHVLSLDADECLSDELKKNIINTKKNWVFDGYSFNRLTNYCGQWIRHCGWYPDEKLRLWDTSKGSWQGQNPHDEFRLLKGAKKGFLKGDLLHYSIGSIKEHLQVIEKFSSIAANEMYNKGIKYARIRSWFHPIAKFIKQFIIRLGFLDGLNGLRVCYNSAYSTHLKYKKLSKLYDEVN